MKISEVIFALKKMQETYGDVDVCIDKSKKEFVDVKEVINFSYSDKKESFVAMTNVPFDKYK